MELLEALEAPGPGPFGNFDTATLLFVVYPARSTTCCLCAFRRLPLMGLLLFGRFGELKVFNLLPPDKNTGNKYLRFPSASVFISPLSGSKERTAGK